MSFTEKAKLTALAIVHIFETSKPLGDYSACVVLNDHAGITYGVNQFTHRSGSLYDVVVSYLGKGGIDGRTLLIDNLPILKDTSPKAVNVLANNANFKAALRRAGRTPEMRAAQNEVAFKRYLQPAIKACEGSGFEQPLSLAVIYDSINHGSYEKIRDRVSVKPGQFMSPSLFERAWITEYVGARDHWLESVPRLAPTDYRTDFFLAQIGRKNWTLDLPLNVHGHVLTEDQIGAHTSTNEVRSEVERSETPQESAPILPSVQQNVDKGENDSSLPNTTALNPQADAQSSNDQSNFSFGGYLKKVEEKFDGVHDVASGVVTRKDAAKSLWTTIGGSISQVFWRGGSTPRGVDHRSDHSWGPYGSLSLPTDLTRQDPRTGEGWPPRFGLESLMNSNSMKNIFIAWIANLPAMMLAVDTQTLITIISAIVLPCLFFMIGKTADLLVQIHFRRKQERKDNHETDR